MVFRPKVNYNKLMKKLLLILFISLGITNPANAESIEQVNLTCTFYETFYWDDLRTEQTTGVHSLIVFPSIGKYLYNGIESYYRTEGNKIMFSHVNEDIGLRWGYSLDRTTSIFETDFSMRSAKTGNKFKIGLTHKGKCKKTENLF